MTRPVRLAAIYTRISEDREGRELGVQRQEKDCRTLAESLDLAVYDVYCDNDKSASVRSKKFRKEYQRLVDDARAGRVQVVIAYTSSRLTRRPREHEDLIELAEKHGVRFEYVASPSFDLNTAAGQTIARILAATDAGEAIAISERITRKHKELAEAGKLGGGGTRPFGFEEDRLTVRQSEAEQIQRGARAILEEGQTIHGLCREWNHAGITTSQGKLWRPVIMRRMLMSGRVSGRREHLRQIVAEAEWPAIISAEDSDRLRELLSDPARTTNAAGNARKYLLSGFLFCGSCGRKMKARAQSDHQPSYVCADVGMAHMRMIGEPLELYVFEAAMDYLDEFIDLASAVRSESEAAVASSEALSWQSLRNYQGRLEQAETAFWVDGRMSEATFRRVSRELTANIERVQDELAKFQRARGLTVLPSSSAAARAQWAERSLDWRRRLITALIERVTVNPGVRGRNRFDPNRVVITFRQPE